MSANKKLRSIRKARGLTQVQLAQLSCCTDAAIRHYESGRRALKGKALQNIAQALNVDPETLSNTHQVETARELLEVLLAAEEDFGIFPDETADGIVLKIDSSDRGNPKLAALIKAWQNQRKALISGEITKQEYEEWKLSFH